MAQPPPKKQTAPELGHTSAAPQAGPGAVGADAENGRARRVSPRVGFSDPALVLRWAEIAGPEVARLARPLRFSEKEGTLTLMAEPAAALFLAHESRTQAARINAWSGPFRAVTTGEICPGARLSQRAVGPVCRQNQGKPQNPAIPRWGISGPENTSRLRCKALHAGARAKRIAAAKRSGADVSKKQFILLGAVLALCLAGGVGWYVSSQSSDGEAVAAVGHRRASRNHRQG